ncbi:MAG: autotransporter domain-containing protein [Schwartzia sp.]|nr:autotransporter domain-containing protein [Schwartzia sp. (in: firmicutes)]
MKHMGGRKLARLIMCAVLAGGAAWTPSMASAVDVNIVQIDAETNDTVAVSAALPDGVVLDPVVGTANTNSLTVKGGTWTDWYIFGGTADGKNLLGYSLTLDGVTLKGGSVVAGAATLVDAENNHLILRNVDIDTTSSWTAGSGGWYESIGEGHNAKNNTLTVESGTVKAPGGLFGGWTALGDAVENKVIIKGGTIQAEIIGGKVGDNFNPDVSTGNAIGNTVTIEGGTVNGNIIGGKSEKGNASDNIVTISGNANLAETAMIYGGIATNGGNATGNNVNILTAINVAHIAGGDGATSTGNTLNVTAKGVATGSMRDFQTLNFYLPKDMTTDDKMLTVTGEANVTNADVGVMAQGRLTNLKEGDKVTLLNAATLTGGATIEQNKRFHIPVSIAHTYEMTVASDDNNIYAELTKVDNGGEATENTKSVVETKAATTTFINAGADMLAFQGFSEAANAVAMEMAENAKNGTGAQPVGGFTPFAAFGGSSLRAESGSHVDTKGFGLNVGFARELPNSQGKLLFGPVVEYGGGSYDSYLDNGVHGDGNAHYFGLGLMARQVNHDGFYYEGSLRGGRVKSDYKGAFNLQNVDYDSSSNYWAAHLGFGKVFAVGGSNTLDGYVKYFYSHQSGDSVTLHGSVTGDEDWSFDSVDSNRIRIGARLTHKVNERNSFYGGLAYQYEFSGDATAHYADGSTPSPSVKGSSGLLELGWQVKPGEGPLTLDLGVTGWAGKQRGGSVQLGATWSF